MFCIIKGKNRSRKSERFFIMPLRASLIILFHPRILVKILMIDHNQSLRVFKRGDLLLVGW